MMSPNKSFPMHLGSIKYNSVSARYEVNENGITYHLLLEHTKMIEDNVKSMARWYDGLDAQTKEQVWITEHISSR